jgi:hypothetical protein
VDYSLIYASFISDRRKRESALTGYSERHHVLPRHLGGGDGAHNLIRLSAGDHIFAHLLLAKVHGGRMWLALILMMRPARQLGIRSRGRRARRIAALAMRKQSEIQTGVKRPDVSAKLRGRPKSEEHRRSLSISRTGHRDSPEVRAKKRAAMNDPAIRSRIYTPSRAKKISERLKGRERTAEHCAAIARKAKGRYAGTANPRHDKSLRQFVHADGRTEILTKFAMAQKHGLNRACLNYVIAGQRSQTKGWSYRGVFDEGRAQLRMDRAFL